ncbi:MAG: hypothetical protein OEV49_10990 [candidate division Zixibacteria bacterium]|nr:hypothetical protein [candidate division Zixibacteria bacterium]MDH3935827.1 hypothetical protein [candidate division Zixibacteria bacterium]
MELSTFKVSIPLKKKFTVAGGDASIKTNLLIVLNNRYPGEAAPSVQYGPSVDDLLVDIEKGLEVLRNLDTIDTDTLALVDGLQIDPTARAALTGMVLNYISGETRRYPWEVMSLSTPVGIKSSFTVAIAETNEMIRDIKKSAYPIVKVKMGHEQDVMLLDALSQIKDKEIRVDANGGWSCAKAEEMIHHLGECGVTVIEQPTSIDFVKEWPHLKGKQEQVELIIDEGLGSGEDYDQCREFVDGVNLKMEKCGGILKAMELARRAREDGKKIMLGCMVESSVGIAQSVYMSSLADYFDLDGPLLLEDDIARGISFDMESIRVDREIIGGPKLKRDVVEKYISR